MAAYIASHRGLLNLTFKSSSCNIKYRNGQKQLWVFVLHTLICSCIAAYLQYRSNGSYHSLARWESRLSRQVSHLARRASPLVRRENNELSAWFRCTRQIHCAICMYGITVNQFVRLIQWKTICYWVFFIIFYDFQSANQSVLWRAINYKISLLISCLVERQALHSLLSHSK